MVFEVLHCTKMSAVRTGQPHSSLIWQIVLISIFYSDHEIGSSSNFSTTRATPYWGKLRYAIDPSNAPTKVFPSANIYCLWRKLILNARCMDFSILDAIWFTKDMNVEYIKIHLISEMSPIKTIVYLSITKRDNQILLNNVPGNKLNLFLPIRTHIWATRCGSFLRQNFHFNYYKLRLIIVISDQIFNNYSS